MKKFLLILFGLSLWPAMALAEGEVFITQIQITGGAGKTTEDFVEFFNPSQSPINLKDMRLVKRSENASTDTLIKSWQVDTFVPARSFYLWANSGFSSIAIQPDTTTSGSLSDNNGIALRNGANDTGTLIDSVSWGSANNGFNKISEQNPEGGMALWRTDINSTASTFYIASSSPRNSLVTDGLLGTPTSTPPTTTPEILGTSTPTTLSTSSFISIYRFLPNPLGDDSGKEWVEIISTDENVVNLEGWLLDDKDTGGGPDSGAFVLSGIINPGEIKKIIIPPGSFALNNSGGDEVNLYFPDQALAQKAVYLVAAYDDGIFEYRDGAWQPPQQPSGGGGGGSSNSSAVNQTTAVVKFKINEIFPNPPGDDSGKEWVEIYNPTNATSSLEGYYLSSGESDAWSSAAWIIPKNYLVPPEGLLSLELPKNSFAFKNFGDKLKLFSPQKQLLDSVIFSSAPENRSWAKNTEGEWEWVIPTFGLPNNQEPEKLSIFLSEILPNPGSDSEEFVEIYNPATTTKSLEGVSLAVGGKTKIFGQDNFINPQSFLVLWEDDLPAKLTNAGQTVKLTDQYGLVLSSITYEKAKAGFAYASMDGKDFIWTSAPSPGEENKMVLGENIITSNVSLKPSSNTKSKTTNASAPDLKKLLDQNENLQTQIAMLQESVTMLSQQVQSLNASKILTAENPSLPVENNPAPSLAKWAVMAGGVAILVGVVYLILKKIKI